MSAYVPISPVRTREILEHLAQVLTPRSLKDSRLSKLTRQSSQHDTDCLRVGIVFMTGFGAIRTGGLGAEPSVRDWTKEKGAEVRASRVVAHLIALGLCAALDDVLPKIVSLGKRHSSTFWARYQLLGEKGLDAAIRPSAKRELDWPRDLLRAFSVKGDDLVAQALQDLVGARNSAAHELPPEPPDYWADRIQVWEEAATWLVQSLALRLDDLLARGR